MIDFTERRQPHWRVRGADNRYAYPGELMNLGTAAFDESTLALMDEETLPALNRRAAFDPDGTLLWQDANGLVLARVVPTPHGYYELPADTAIVLERVAA